jgi:hypothetical protein
MQREQRCCICSERKPRHQFSVANGICMDCFDRSYAFCEECGVTVYRPNTGITRSQYGRATTHNGQTVCGDCSYRIGGGRPSDSCWRPKPLEVSVATYDRIGSKRKFGVEIETSRCDDYRLLFGRTSFGAKTDCTVRGMEFDSPIMYGDEGFAVIEEILAYGDENGWRADSSCGCHTHYDMRDESFDQLCSILYAYRKTTELWARFVPSNRRSGSYSHMPEWYTEDVPSAVQRGRNSCEDTDSRRFGQVLSNLGTDRYDMVNFGAYFDHRTFEVRMLEGTVDPQTICNWVSVSARFMDAARDMTFDEIDDLFNGDLATQFEALAAIIGDDDLIDWLEARASEFGYTLRPAQPAQPNCPF